MKTERWMQVKALIIDEISMLSGEYFEMLEKAVSQDVFGQPDKPFGGIQIIVAGVCCPLSFFVIDEIVGLL